VSIIKETSTGENYLQKTTTTADSPGHSAVQLYESQNGSEGTSSNTIYTLTLGTYVTGSNTLMVFINGQKCERMDSPLNATQYSETNSTTVTFGATLQDADFVEFVVAGAYLLDGTDVNDLKRFWYIISVDTNATVFGGYLIDASGGNVTLTLPIAPSVGDYVGVCDYRDQAEINVITVARNGKLIESASEDLVVDVAGSSFDLIYTDAARGWQVLSLTGTSGIALTDIVDDLTPQLGGDLDANGNDITIDNLTASKPVFTDASKVLVSTGTLGVDQGGTGATTASSARDNIGLGDLSTLNSPLQVVSGGTGAVSLTDGGLLLGSGTDAITALGAASNGEIPIGDGTTDPQLGTITAGEGIDITNGAGSITVAGEDASATNKGVVELATGAESLTGTSGTLSVTPSAMDYVLDNRNPNMVNLLGNSGFGVWSNSEDLYTTAGTVPSVGDGYDLITYGNMEAGTGDPWLPTNWTKYAGTEGTGELAEDTSDKHSGSASLKINVSSASEGINSEPGTYEAGKLYEISAWIKRTSGTLVVGVYDNGVIPRVTISSGYATWTQLTFVHEALDTSFLVQFASSGGAAVFGIDDVSVHEVTPGIVSGTAGPDGWYKSAGLYVYREHDGANTKDGSFYSLKIYNPTGSAETFLWNGGQLGVNVDFCRNLNGRTLAAGAWVKADGASKVKLKHLTNGATYADTSTLNVGTDYEWLEGSFVVDTDVIDVRPFALDIAAGATAYISQPMLVFGSSIGEGNFCAPVGEVVWLEDTNNFPTGWNNSSLTTGDSFGLEVITSGQLPKGVVAFFAMIEATADAASRYLFLKATGVTDRSLRISSAGNVACSAQGWVILGSNGNFIVETSGAWTTGYIRIVAAQVSP